MKKIRVLFGILLLCVLFGCDQLFEERDNRVKREYLHHNRDPRLKGWWKEVKSGDFLCVDVEKATMEGYRIEDMSDYVADFYYWYSSGDTIYEASPRSIKGVSYFNERYSMPTEDTLAIGCQVFYRYLGENPIEVRDSIRLFWYTQNRDHRLEGTYWENKENKKLSRYFGVYDVRDKKGIKKGREYIVNENPNQYSAKFVFWYTAFDSILYEGYPDKDTWVRKDSVPYTFETDSILKIGETYYIRQKSPY